MRTLEWDEVLGLEKFMVEDNDEIIGIEIHVGKDWRNGYSEPDSVVKYSLEELSGGELIELEDVILCAVVGDKLYYRKKKYESVGSTSLEYVYRGVSKDTEDYMYARAMLSYNCPLIILPEEEVVFLDKILVRDNKRVESVRFFPGYCGVGGSNTSGFSTDWDSAYEYTSEELDGRSPLWIHGEEVCALVNDVLYFRYKGRDGNMHAYTLDYRERTTLIRGDGVAYDTIAATEVYLIMK